MWRVLVSAPYFIPVIEEYRQRLAKEDIELIPAQVNERLSEAELLEVIGDIDGMICGDDRITKRVLDAAPRLKVISKWGTGIDSIDSEEAKRRGIPVYRTPNAFSEPVADTVLGYILTFARKLSTDGSGHSKRQMGKAAPGIAFGMHLGCHRGWRLRQSGCAPGQGFRYAHTRQRYRGNAERLYFGNPY